MKKYQFILYSTTRQYNPGDEFILFGVRNLLKHIGVNDTPVIFNRNQEVNQPLSFLNPLRKVKGQSKWVKALGSFLRISQVDNSFKDIHDIDMFDMIVFAGSPEWYSSRLNTLYNKLKNYKKPILFLGVGSFGEIKYISPLKRKILERASLITYRTKQLNDFFCSYERASYLPCPALFSVAGVEHSLVTGKIAICFGVSEASKGNHVSNNAMNKMINAYNFLKSENYIIEIVCHYIDELPFAIKYFPEAEIRYSYDAKDYEDIYKQYQYVVTSRVHAIGICASLGIPGTLIAHDGRANTVVYFQADVIPDTVGEKDFKKSVIDRINDSENLSIKLKDHKLLYLEKYKELLTSSLGLKNERL